MPHVDAKHRGPLVELAALITLAVMILFTASKVTTKWRMIRKMKNDDIFMIFALLTAVGQFVATSLEVQSGLGQPEGDLTTQQLDLYQKAAYVSQIFYVFTIFLAKMAALQFLMTLAPQKEPKLKRATMKGAIGFIIVWLVIAVLCISFQCDVPHTRNQASGRCFNQLAFWTVNGVIDIVSQLLIGVAPVFLLYSLQLPPASKRLAMVSFTPNTTTIPLVVLRVVYLFHAKNSSDLTMSSYNAALIPVIHANYSIIASCLPFIKPLIDSLAIGLMTNNIRVPLESADSTKKKDKINPFAILSGTRFNTRNLYGWTRSQSSGYSATVTAGTRNEVELQDLERYGSQDGMIINQTRTTVVASDLRSLQP